MTKEEQPKETKTTIEVEEEADIRRRMTLGEASDISSMTLLRRQLEQEDKEDISGGGE